MSRHYDAELQDALDGRLDPVARGELESHLAACASCRAAYERLRWVKAALAVSRDDEEVPATLRARVRAALDEEDRVTEALPHAPPPGRPMAKRARWAAALAAGLVLAGGVALLTRSHRAAPDPVATLAQDFGRYRSGAFPLAVTTDDPKRLQAFFAAQGLGFNVRVLDLGMMGYRLVGGGTSLIDDRPIALIAYRSDSGRIVLCAMYVGDAAVAASGGEVRDHGGFTFYIHRDQGTTIVFWQEGTVACALVSDGEPEQVIQLAFAKAMRAT